MNIIGGVMGNWAAAKAQKAQAERNRMKAMHRHERMIAALPRVWCKTSIPEVKKAVTK